MTLAVPVAFPLLSNLQSLAHQAAKGIGHLDISSAVDCIVSPIFVKTGATVIAGGRFTLLLVTAAEIVTPSRFTNTIDPDAATQQTTLMDSNMQTACFVQRIDGGSGGMQANTTYCFSGFSVKAVLGFRPAFFAPLVWNLSGGATSATAGDFYGKFQIET